MSDIQAKLDRITARVKKRSGNARAMLERHPHLLEFCELARERFGAKLIWLQDSEGEIGKRLEYELGTDAHGNH